MYLITWSILVHVQSTKKILKNIIGIRVSQNQNQSDYLFTYFWVEFYNQDQTCHFMWFDNPEHKPLLCHMSTDMWLKRDF
jgi:hypothetical protein